MPGDVPFFRHDLGEPELDMIREVLAGDILTHGAYVERFEEQFAAYLGIRHALGVAHCTGALHMALMALGIGPGDEVITTALTFVATAAAIMEAGARPVLVDVEPETGNIDCARVEAAITPRTRAIIPVHLYGQMCDMRRLRAIADRHGLALIEDAAHCIEGERDGVRPGQLGDAACFSFYATKNLACGEGGAIAFNDTGLLDRLRLLRLHGVTKTAADRAREGYTHWDMTILGWKYNLSNIQAALLLPQMERLDRKLAERRALYADYCRRLELPGVAMPAVLPGRHAHHLFTVWVENRDAVLEGLQARGIGVVVNYRPIHQTTFFSGALGLGAGAFPVAEAIGERTLSLPFYPGMPPDHVGRVVDALSQLTSRG